MIHILILALIYIYIYIYILYLLIHTFIHTLIHTALVDCIPQRRNETSIRNEMDNLKSKITSYRPARTYGGRDGNEKDRLGQIFEFKGGKALPTELTSIIQVHITPYIPYTKYSIYMLIIILLLSAISIYHYIITNCRRHHLKEKLKERKI